MIELIGPILTLGVIFIGFGVMLGQISLSDAVVKIAALVAGAFLCVLGIRHAQATWQSLTDETRAAVVLLILFVVLPLLILRSVLKSRLGREVGVHLIADWIKDKIRGK